MSDENNNGGEHVHTEGDGHDHSAAPVTAPAETAEATSATASDGVSEHKLFAIIGYILPFLFFIPLIQDNSKNNAFARLHANQQAIILVLWLGITILGNILFVIIGYGLYSLISIAQLVLFVFAILGIINAAQGEAKELPVIGKFNIVDKLFKK